MGENVTRRSEQHSIRRAPACCAAARVQRHPPLAMRSGMSAAAGVRRWSRSDTAHRFSPSEGRRAIARTQRQMEQRRHLRRRDPHVSPVLAPISSGPLDSGATFLLRLTRCGPSSNFRWLERGRGSEWRNSCDREMSTISALGGTPVPLPSSDLCPVPVCAPPSAVVCSAAAVFKLTCTSAPTIPVDERGHTSTVRGQAECDEAQRSVGSPLSARSLESFAFQRHCALGVPVLAGVRTRATSAALAASEPDETDGQRQRRRTATNSRLRAIQPRCCYCPRDSRMPRPRAHARSRSLGALRTQTDQSCLLLCVLLGRRDSRFHPHRFLRLTMRSLSILLAVLAVSHLAVLTAAAPPAAAAVTKVGETDPACVWNGFDLSGMVGQYAKVPAGPNESYENTVCASVSDFLEFEEFGVCVFVMNSVRLLKLIPFSLRSFLSPACNRGEHLQPERQ
jgi:hypothetical protein